jgi:hypothetical protein
MCVLCQPAGKGFKAIIARVDASVRSKIQNQVTPHARGQHLQLLTQAEFASFHRN